MSHDFPHWRDSALTRIEAALDGFLTLEAQPRLGEAMRYATLGGGKRIRALLSLATAEALGGHAEAASRAACALEMIHAYSLVHDDMPCMDNDNLRRGKPTVHIAYGEAVALLAGDTLQARAFEILTPDAASVPPALQATLCRLLAQAAGQTGMCGGQAIDLLSVGKALTQAELENMHRLKTGALLEAAVMMGAACASDLAATTHTHLQSYARHLGLAFQVMDDVLDCTADSATLGKTAGKDAENDKPTYVSLMGLAAARQYAHDLHALALAALTAAHLPQSAHLQALAASVVQRAA
jgi:farnesyl diphosphate synthase